MKNLSIILCKDKNNLIGLKTNTSEQYVLPWVVDDKHLMSNSQTTINNDNPIVMGYQTFISRCCTISNVNQKIIVLTNTHYDELVKQETNNLKVCKTFDDCLKYIDTTEEFFIVGGSTLFNRYMEEAERIYVTELQSYISYIPQDSPLIIEKQYVQSINKTKFKIISDCFISNGSRYTVWSKIK